MTNVDLALGVAFKLMTSSWKTLSYPGWHPVQWWVSISQLPRLTREDSSPSGVTDFFPLTLEGSRGPSYDPHLVYHINPPTLQLCLFYCLVGKVVAEVCWRMIQHLPHFQFLPSIFLFFFLFFFCGYWLNLEIGHCSLNVFKSDL